MKENLKKYIDMLFEDAPKTRKALELKEELLVNTEERYQDLIAKDVTPEDAYKNVITSLGNVSELFEELVEDDQMSQKNETESLKKRALLQSISVALYFFGAAVLIAFSMLEDSDFLPRGIEWSQAGLAFLLLIYGVAVCMQVYATKAYPKYQKMEDTVVEEFKEWKSGRSRKNELRNAINIVIWMFSVVIYFIFSFVTYRWDVSWIIFLIGVLGTAIVRLIFSLSDSDSGKEKV